MLWCSSFDSVDFSPAKGMLQVNVSNKIIVRFVINHNYFNIRRKFIEKRRVFPFHFRISALISSHTHTKRATPLITQCGNERKQKQKVLLLNRETDRYKRNRIKTRLDSVISVWKRFVAGIHNRKYSLCRNVLMAIWMISHLRAITTLWNCFIYILTGRRSLYKH